MGLFPEKCRPPKTRAHMSLTETAGSERDPHVGQPSGQLKKFEGEENGVERERERERDGERGVGSGKMG